MVYDSFALKSNPINEAINTYGALQNIRLREEEAAANKDQRALARRQTEGALELQGLQIADAKRRAQQETDRQVMSLYRQDVATGKPFQLKDPGHAEIFKRYGLPIADGGVVEIGGDEVSQVKALRAASPVYAGQTDEEMSTVVQNLTKAGDLIGKLKGDKELQASAKNGRLILDAKNQPELFASLNTALSPQINKGSAPGETKSLETAYIDTASGKVIFEVGVYGDDGTLLRTGPITVERGTGTNENIRMTPLAGFEGYINANAELGRRYLDIMSGLGDKRAEKDLSKSEDEADAKGAIALISGARKVAKGLRGEQRREAIAGFLDEKVQGGEATAKQASQALQQLSSDKGALTMVDTGGKKVLVDEGGETVRELSVTLSPDEAARLEASKNKSAQKAGDVSAAEVGLAFNLLSSALGISDKATTNAKAKISIPTDANQISISDWGKALPLAEDPALAQKFYVISGRVEQYMKEGNGVSDSVRQAIADYNEAAKTQRPAATPQPGAAAPQRDWSKYSR